MCIDLEALLAALLTKSRWRKEVRRVALSQGRIILCSRVGSWLQTQMYILVITYRVTLHHVIVAARCQDLIH